MRQCKEEENIVVFDTIVTPPLICILLVYVRLGVWQLTTFLNLFLTKVTTFRSTFTECEKEVCPHSGRCSNQRLQRRQYAPGLERFMTQKKGWGVRARQSIPSGR